MNATVRYITFSNSCSIDNEWPFGVDSSTGNVIRPYSSDKAADTAHTARMWHVGSGNNGLMHDLLKMIPLVNLMSHIASHSLTVRQTYQNPANLRRMLKAVSCLDGMFLENI